MGAIMPAVKKIGRRGSRTRDFCIAMCSLSGLVLVWSRLANLGTSFWGDEAYSAYYYADRGPHAIFFGTYVPNNHVLFNLLNWVTTGAIGHFEAAYRIWSVVPGLAAVALDRMVGVEAPRPDHSHGGRDPRDRVAGPPGPHPAGAGVRPRNVRVRPDARRGRARK